MRCAMGCGASASASRPLPALVSTGDGNSSLGAASEGKDRKLILLLHSASHLPPLDWTKESDPYVLAHAEQGGNQVGEKARWACQASCSNPCWNLAQDLGISKHRYTEDDQLHIEVWDYDPLKADKIIGHLDLPIADLHVDTWYEKPLSLSSASRERISARAKGRILDESLQPNLRLMVISEPVQTKSIFLIRHGESVWNKAQKNKNVSQMMKQVDHPLSVDGLRQGKDLAQKLTAAVAKLEEEGSSPSEQGEVSANLRQLLSTEVVMASPLTRAVETALVGVGPILKRTGVLRLCRNAREKRNTGGRDTTGTARGEQEIAERARKALIQAGGTEAEVSEYCSVRIDATESHNKWWNDSSESMAKVQDRIHQFLQQLRYMKEERVAVIGHSLFFRALLKNHMHESASVIGPGTPSLKELTSKKLMNCGVAAITLDFTRHVQNPITAVELLLDTKLT